MARRKKSKKPVKRNWRNNDEIMDLRKQRTQTPGTKLKKVKETGVFSLSDEQRRRLNFEGVEHVLSKEERIRLEKERKIRKIEREQKLRKEAEKKLVVRKVVSGGAPTLGKRSR